MQSLRSKDPKGVAPGEYLVETASGSTYLISVPHADSIHPPTAIRVPKDKIDGLDEPFFASMPLYKDTGTIDLIAFHFEVGRSGAMTFRDEAARESPGYIRGDNDYEVTIRQTTLVTRIRRIDVDDMLAHETGLEAQ